MVLAIDPTLLYLIGEPDDPVEVWTKLQEQFMRKSWVNRLELRRKLYSLKLLEGESVLEHVRKMTELFNGFAAVGDPLSDEDRVVHLLASLPESYSVLVTALEASPEVPKIELVTERLLHEERKLRSSSNDQDIRALASRVRVTRGLKVRCYYCDEVGHFKSDCPKFAERFKQKSNSALLDFCLNLSANFGQKRFGHLSAGGLRELAASRLVDGFGFNFDGGKDIELCEPCVKGKHHKSPFPVSSGMLAEEPLDLVHTDLCGKVNAKSIGGSEYFLVFVDDKTRYVWVYFLKRKDEVFSRFIEWKTMVEKSGSRKLKKLRSDNGGEFTSTRFQEYLKAEGVIHELTIPKTPQQNGVAERFNRTLVEMTRCMLVGANLSHKLWAEALSTAAYLKNRSPARAITGMTPFEAYYGTKPSVNHLRVFGCTSYAHIVKDERKKLDPVARKCVLIGYGTVVKGYHLYDPNRDTVFYSRDVRFKESEVGLQKEHDDIPPICDGVEFDCEELSESIMSEEVSGNVLPEDTEPDSNESPESSIVDPECVLQPQVRRSQRVRQRPNYFIEGSFSSCKFARRPCYTSYISGGSDRF